MMDVSDISTTGCLPDSSGLAAPGSVEEKQIFRSLQQEFEFQFRYVFPNRVAPKTVVIVPSMTLDREILSKVKGHVYYEERLLCLLMLLRMPQTNVVYISSVPVDQVTIDYYLHLLPGITGNHARQRLTMLSCYDASAKPLTEKILERPRLLNRIKQNVSDADHCHMVCFNVTERERTLAVRLGIPIYGCDPDLTYLGSKTGARLLFKECGVPLPDGFENLMNENDILDALVRLKSKKPNLKKAILKLNDGFSGEGNAIFVYPYVTSTEQLEESIRLSLHDIHVVSGVSSFLFFDKFRKEGGVVEEYIDAEVKFSPSAQCRINPLGEVEVVSTHDQVLGGEQNQIFVGATFPARSEYAKEIGALATVISKKMGEKGVLGRFSIDFLSTFENNRWHHSAIEINLRKGGTTHPFLMLQFLTDGKYDAFSGKYVMQNGQSRYYYASDNVVSKAYQGLTPADLIDIAMFHGIMFDNFTQEGVMFHLIGAVSQYGKFGMVCIAETPERVELLYKKTIEILDCECVSNALLL